MTDTIDLANAAQAAYDDLVSIMRQLEELSREMQGSKDAITVAYSEDVGDVAIDADIAAGMLSMVIHDSIEVDTDDIA